MSVFGRWFSGPSETASPPAAPSGPSATEREASASASAPPAASTSPSTTLAPAKSAEPHHAHTSVEPVQVEHGYDSPEPDLYRTFSPSEVAFWDLKAPADGQSGSGFFARFFSGGGAGGSGGK